VYARIAVKLDALSPKELMDEIEIGIKQYLNVGTIEGELEVEKQERAKIIDLRSSVIQHIKNIYIFFRKLVFLTIQTTIFIRKNLDPTRHSLL